MMAAMSEPPHAIPRDEDEIRAAAAGVGLAIPDACLPGVMANLALLRSHAETLLGNAKTGR